MARGSIVPELGQRSGCLLKCSRINRQLPVALPGISLYMALLARGLLPTLYTTARVYFLGQLPRSSGMDIVSQLAWVGLLLEVLEEALITPLYHCIGATIGDRGATINKVHTGLVVSLALYSTAGILIASLASPLVAAMAQQAALRRDTVSCIRLQMVAATVQGLEHFVHAVLVVLGYSRHICIKSLLHAATSVMLDYALVSHLSGSLQLGVIGVVLSNLGSYTVALSYAVLALVRGLRWTHNDLIAPLSWSWLPSWWRVGRWAAVVSLVRNTCYAAFIVRSVNLLSGAGIYWTANQFIWGWLLLPFTPLAQLLQQRVANAGQGNAGHLRLALPYVLLALCLFALWCATMPAWRSFFRHVLNVQQPEAELELVRWLLPYYLPYMLVSLTDAIFYGSGSAFPVVVAAVVTNVGVYGCAFMLSMAGVLPVTMHSVVTVFGIGMVAGLLARLCLHGIRSTNSRH